MPAGAMAMARINVPSIYVYAGTIKPGHWKGQALTIVSAFEAVGAFAAGKMDKADYDGVEHNACPSVGACGGMFTANTMSSSFEALGISLLGSSQMASPDAREGGLGRREREGAGQRDREGPEAARHHHAQVDRERDRARDGDRRLDQRGAALPRDRRGGAGAVDHRRLRGGAQARAGAVRPEALGQVRRDRLPPRRRRAAGAADAARARPAARRLHDDHRPHDRRGTRVVVGRAARRPGRDPALVEADVRARPPRDPQGQPRAGRLRREDHRPQESRRSPGRRACSTPSRSAWRRSWRRRSTPATSS